MSPLFPFFGQAKSKLRWGKARRPDASEESNVLGATDSQLNDFCIVSALRYGTFDVLLTGDADSHVEAKYDQLQAFINPVEVFKVPHHGSKTGMNAQFVE